MKLKNKIAVVTGGSSGIGQSGAIELAKEGADLLITFRGNKEGATETQNKIKELGRRCEIIRVDLESLEDMKMVITETINKFSKIDILVNNAGEARFTDFLNDSIDNLDYLLNVDVKSIFSLSQLAAKEMIKNGRGSIINITSISGIYINDPGLLSYCVSKAAANMLTKGMAKALAEYNIRVNAILPGSIDTPATQKAPKEVVEETIKMTPMKKIGDPEDISKMIVFMASDDSKFMTGSLVVIDGGLTL